MKIALVKKSAPSQSGFTLVELLVAIGIIGVLSSIAVVSIGNVRLKARDVKRLSDIKTIQTALVLYSEEKKTHPRTDEGVSLFIGSANYKVLCSKAGDSQGFYASTDGCEKVFLNPIPSPITPPATDDYKYAYSSMSDDSYAITFKLEGKSGSFEAGDYLASQDGIRKR